MFNKTSLLALAAVAVLGATALSTTDADARGGHGGPGIKGGGHGGPAFAMRGRHPGGHIRPHRPHRHWHGHWRFKRYYYGVRTLPVYTAAPVAGRCTCLIKEYTPEGAVVFKDTCTNEFAMNPAAPEKVTVAPVER